MHTHIQRICYLHCIIIRQSPTSATDQHPSIVWVYSSSVQNVEKTLFHCSVYIFHRSQVDSLISGTSYQLAAFIGCILLWNAHPTDLNGNTN